MRHGVALRCLPLAAAALALTACAGDDTPTAAPTLPTTTGPAPTTVRPPVTLAPRTLTPVTTTPDPYLGLPLVDHLSWTTNEDGPRLQVFPTEAGRYTKAPGTDELAWREILARDPGADTPGMRDQFVCHWVWARMVQPDKPSWNLEPWRPDVGYQATVQANCNPGGPER